MYVANLRYVLPGTTKAIMESYCSPISNKKKQQEIGLRENSSFR